MGRCPVASSYGGRARGGNAPPKVDVNPSATNLLLAASLHSVVVVSSLARRRSSWHQRQHTGLHAPARRLRPSPPRLYSKLAAAAVQRGLLSRLGAEAYHKQKDVRAPELKQKGCSSTSSSQNRGLRPKARKESSSLRTHQTMKITGKAQAEAQLEGPAKRSRGRLFVNVLVARTSMPCTFPTRKMKCVGATAAPLECQAACFAQCANWSVHVRTLRPADAICC